MTMMELVSCKRMWQLLICLAIVAAQEHDVESYLSSPNGLVQGELRLWHKVTIGFEGPDTDATATPNPFLDYRLDVTFSHRSHGPFVVPGYYAANGNAANDGSGSGNVWLVHFAPMEEGTWNWEVSFTAGPEVATIDGGNTSAGFFDGASGSFVIGPTDKTGRDLRSKGLLSYVGGHHLQFAGTSEFFLKAGADSPENFLAYEDFDNTPNTGGYRKNWAPHIQDYRRGDPTWKGGLGMGIIGAVNYLASKGMNVFSFLTMNIEGDDKNVFPFLSPEAGDDRLRYDVSKLAQWEVVFEHADRMGMYLHFKTQEQENDQLLDGGELGTERKLYYRELVARFSHHLALNWNIGEENTNTDTQRKAFATHFKHLDPYNHHVVVHTFPQHPRSVYTPLLGFGDIDGASLQVHPDNQFERALEWIQKSAQAGHKWVVTNDEQGSAQDGVLPDAIDPSHDDIRKKVLWANFMAGGAGVEYYFGYRYASSDLTCEDFRSRENLWTQSKHALDFFNLYRIPFWNMANVNYRVTEGNYCLAEGNDDVIVVYLPSGGDETMIDLSGENNYAILWYDPLLGGKLQVGSVTQVSPYPQQPLGSPPYSPNQDWVIRLERVLVPESANVPTAQPISTPATQPSGRPTRRPSFAPSARPTRIPAQSAEPSNFPSASDSDASSAEPSDFPSGSDSDAPSADLSNLPSIFDTDAPSVEPSYFPSLFDSDAPSIEPSISPSVSYSAAPSIEPSQTPSDLPTLLPSDKPSSSPSLRPSVQSSNLPSKTPTSSIATSGEIISQADEGDPSTGSSATDFAACQLSFTALFYLALAVIFYWY